VAHSFLPEKKVDFSTYRQYMLSALARMEPSEKNGFGGVRFIAPSAYLSAPARLYAFLGMNGEVFPRNSHRLSFDLSDPALPQKADYDRHLFLNFLLAPRDKVFISYLGRNVKNNDSIPPSALLEELWTVVRGFLPSVKELKDFTVHHPLHRFSQQYADPANRLVRYVENKPDTQRIWKEKASEDRRKIWEKDDRGRIVIPLEQLVRFVEDPVRHYYNRVLRVYYFDREKETEERELFSLGNLDGWAVKDQILTDRLMGNQHPNRLRLELKQKGVLPLKHLGEVGYEDANEAVNEVIAAVGELVHHRPVTIDLELPIGDRYVIQGKIASVYEDLSKYLFVTTSNDKPKYQIRALVHHQLLQLDGRWPNMELRYVAKKDGRSINLPGDPEFIQAICDKMLEGTERLIPFSIHCLNKFELGNQASLQEQAILRLEDPNDGYSFSEYFGNIVKKELLDNEESQRDFEAMFHLTKRMIDQYFSKK
jgi:exodeoxyribonuclease V gamma subunit